MYPVTALSGPSFLFPVSQGKAGLGALCLCILLALVSAMISSTIMSPLHALQAKASLEALRVHIHQILIYFPYPNDPAKKLNFPQIFRNFAQKLPKMAQSGPNMTQKGPKWPKNDPKWPKNDPKWPKNVLQFFLTEKAF